MDRDMMEIEWMKGWQREREQQVVGSFPFMHAIWYY
jgi:hypothetical protein